VSLSNPPLDEVVVLDPARHAEQQDVPGSVPVRGQGGEGDEHEGCSRIGQEGDAEGKEWV